VSHDLSRKHFVAKGLGLLALAGLAPKLRAFSASGSVTESRVSTPRSAAAFRSGRAAARGAAMPQVRIDPRAVAQCDFAPSSAPTSTAAAAASFRN